MPGVILAALAGAMAFVVVMFVAIGWAEYRDWARQRREERRFLLSLGASDEYAGRYVKKYRGEPLK